MKDLSGWMITRSGPGEAHRYQKTAADSYQSLCGLHGFMGLSESDVAIRGAADRDVRCRVCLFADSEKKAG